VNAAGATTATAAAKAFGNGGARVSHTGGCVMWHEIVGPLKRFSGTSGTIAAKSGWIILNLQAGTDSGGGTVAGIPDGQGGSITLTLPASSNGYNIDPKHLGIVMAADGNIVFSGTTTYYLEVMCKAGF
jgi:hypothetical protein